MTEKTALQELFENNDIKFRSYSGRGMYGKECLAVTTDQFDGDNPVATVVEIVQLMLDDVTCNSDRNDILDDLRRSYMDSMGRSNVIYFPHIKIVVEDE